MTGTKGWTAADEMRWRLGGLATQGQRNLDRRRNAPERTAPQRSREEPGEFTGSGSSGRLPIDVSATERNNVIDRARTLLVAFDDDRRHARAHLLGDGVDKVG